MKTNKQERETRLTVVETHNIALSLKRLNGAPYDGQRKRRALYHALCMEGNLNSTQLTGIRVALELP